MTKIKAEIPGKGHIPTRMCMVCRTRSPKAALARYTRGENDILLPDETQTAEGRGCYLCSEPSCREKFLQGRMRRRGRKA